MSHLRFLALLFLALALPAQAQFPVPANQLRQATAAAQYVALDGTGDSVSTPDSAANSIANSATLEWYGKLGKVTPALLSVRLFNKWGSAGQRSYNYGVQLTTGLLFFQNSDDGTSTHNTSFSTASLASAGLSDGQQIGLRVAIVTIPATSTIFTFSYSTDAGANWTQLGAPVTAGVLTITVFNNTSDLLIGPVGISGTGSVEAGSTTKAIIRNSGGTITVSMDANDYVGTIPSSTGASWTSSATSETWTLQGNAVVD